MSHPPGMVERGVIKTQVPGLAQRLLKPTILSCLFVSSSIYILSYRCFPKYVVQ